MNEMNSSGSEITFLTGLKDTFRFQCRACGKCCGSFTIILSPYDILRLRKATGKSTGELIEAEIIAIKRMSFSRVFGFAPIADFLEVFGLARNDIVPVALLQFGKNDRGKNECRYLVKRKNKRLCGIYADRPTMCRLHPLGCATISGRRKWFFRQPLCKSGGRSQTVEEWIRSSQARPFLRANSEFLRWMQALLSPAIDFHSLPEEHMLTVERILYDFDSLGHNKGKMTIRSISRMFNHWRANQLGDDPNARRHSLRHP